MITACATETAADICFSGTLDDVSDLAGVVYFMTNPLLFALFDAEIRKIVFQYVVCDWCRCCRCCFTTQVKRLLPTRSGTHASHISGRTHTRIHVVSEASKHPSIHLVSIADNSPNSHLTAAKDQSPLSPKSLT